MATESKREELQSLRARVERLEEEIAREETAGVGGPVISAYTAYHATAGFLLGTFGGITSLLFNVIGSLVVNQNPLQLIRIYLTFPLGENALRLSDQTRNVFAIGDGMILAMGCCLYLITGMFLGIPVYLTLAKLNGQASLARRIWVASVVSLLIWGINFYVILAWLQPLLFGGHWIVDHRLLPWWVAAATHLVFGWTIALLYPLCEFTPYRRPAPIE